MTTRSSLAPVSHHAFGFNPGRINSLCSLDAARPVAGIGVGFTPHRSDSPWRAAGPAGSAYTLATGHRCGLFAVATPLDRSRTTPAAAAAVATVALGILTVQRFSRDES